METLVDHEKTNEVANAVKTVDMRSDTLTLPTKTMLSAMVEAPLGDDVFGEDPTINELQRRIATDFGKEAALFLPSGTMGNLVSSMAHCTRRGDEVILGSRCHVHIYEQGGLAAIAGVHHRTVENKPDGTFDLKTVRQLIRGDDAHYPTTRAIWIENTHNACGGRVLPLSFLKEVRSLADEFGLSVHMDGARVINAAVALDVDVKEIVQYVDSVSMCFSKGIGAPFGAVVVGTNEFIRRALRHRKVLGGAMRQGGIMAAAALHGYKLARTTLSEDHRRAKRFASGLAQVLKGSDLLWVDEKAVESNMVFLRCVGGSSPTVAPSDLSDRLGRAAKAEKDVVCVVKALAAAVDAVRLVLNCNHGDEDVELAIRKVEAVHADLLQEQKDKSSS